MNFLLPFTAKIHKLASSVRVLPERFACLRLPPFPIDRIHLSEHEKTLETKHFRLISNALYTLFATRFERATFRLGGGRSIQLSYANISAMPAAVLCC